MFPRNANLVSTKYCTISVKGNVTTQERMIACPAPDGERWCVRSQSQSYDYYGGGEQLHPFSYMALIKDAFNQYKDYTLGKDEALSQLLEFDLKHSNGAFYDHPETYVRRQAFLEARANAFAPS